MLRRERAHASDFNAALHEHQQYLRRRVRPPTFLSSLAAHVFGYRPTSELLVACAQCVTPLSKWQKLRW